MKKLLALAVALILALAAVPAFADGETYVIGVTGAFYEDLWAPAIEALAQEGINVQLQQFSDFSLPNNALNDGSIQLNAFQHHAYFNNDTTTNGYDLAVLADTFVITMNVYSNRYATAEDLVAAADAGQSLTVVVPNDATNYGRALILLNEMGLLTLNEYEGTPNVENIADLKVELVMVNASMTYQYLDDCDAAVINGNYAASYGVDPASAIYFETIDMSNENFICLIAVRSADIENETYKRIAEVFCSDVTSEVANTQFKGFFRLVWEEPETEGEAETEADAETDAETEADTETETETEGEAETKPETPAA